MDDSPVTYTENLKFELQRDDEGIKRMLTLENRFPSYWRVKIYHISVKGKQLGVTTKKVIMIDKALFT